MLPRMEVVVFSENVMLGDDGCQFHHEPTLGAGRGLKTLSLVARSFLKQGLSLDKKSVIATCSHTSRRCLLQPWMIHRETNHLN